MRRRLLNTLTLLSLLLCIAVAAMGVYSYTSYDAVGFWPSPARGKAYGMLSYGGKFCVFTIMEGNSGAHWGWQHSPGRGPEPRLDGAAGFILHREARGTVVGMPHWALCLLLAVAPTLWVVRRRRRLAPGLCPSCGYDLRATPDRCPECGAGAATTARA